MKNKLADTPIRPLLYTMAVPLMLSLLVQSLYNIVDSMFVARLSETALTAASLVYSIQFLMIAVGVGTAVGLNALLSRKIGEHKPEEACQSATTGLLVMLTTSLLFSITGICFSDGIAAKLTSEPELQELCKQYLSINLVYCWGIFLQTYGQRLLQAVGDTVLSMISLIIGAILNIILDPIMIFGLFGCPSMGIKGAAIATVIGQIAGAVAALLFNRFKNPLIHVRFRNYRFDWQDVIDIYRVGLPTIIMQAIGSIMTFVINSILLSVSTTAVAFFGVYYKLQNFLMMPVNGLGQAAIPIVGYNYGAQKIERVQQTWKILLPTGILIALCGTIIFCTFPMQLLQLFSASPEMMVLGIPALRIVSISFAFAAVTILCGYFASGLGNGMINMIGAAIRQFILLIPCLWFFIKTLDITYGWYAFWIAEVTACIYSYCTSHKLLKHISHN